MAPILVANYYRLARCEESAMVERFGPAYQRYMTQVRPVPQPSSNTACADRISAKTRARSSAGSSWNRWVTGRGARSPRTRLHLRDGPCGTS